MPSESSVVTGGVDTHKDVHVAAVIDERGVSGDALWTRSGSAS